MFTLIDGAQMLKVKKQSLYKATGHSLFHSEKGLELMAYLERKQEGEKKTA